MACWAPASSAALIGDFTFGNPATGLSAEAKFDYTGSTLKLTLINTSTFVEALPGQLDPVEVLEGVFWNSAPVSSETNRTNASAVVGTGYPNANGSLLIKDTKVTQLAGYTISSKWGYDQFSYSGANQGVCAAGLSGTGTSPNFGNKGLGSSGNSGNDVNGGDYGIAPASYLTKAGPYTVGETITHIKANTGVTKDPLEWNAVVFTFTGVTDKPDISNVLFQYGTALNTTPAVPIPPSALLLGSGLIGLGLVRWRSRNKVK
jgi:hypothetical protein